MKYEKHPVIEEIRKVRKEIFKEFDCDPHAFGKYLMELDSKWKSMSKGSKREKAHSLAHS